MSREDWTQIAVFTVITGVVGYVVLRADDRAGSSPVASIVGALAVAALVTVVLTVLFRWRSQR